MARSIPFHKQTDPNKQTGQVVNPIPEQFLHQSHKQETTLAQYIAKKDDDPKRITFNEWFTNQYSNPDDEVYEWSLIAWNAALKQGKL